MALLPFVVRLYLTVSQSDASCGKFAASEARDLCFKAFYYIFIRSFYILFETYTVF